MSAVAANYEKLQELGVDIISVSVDSQFVHKMWNDHELKKMAGRDIPFPMASDGPGKIGEMYGVYNADAGIELRGRFIIDPDGVIQAMEVLTPPVGRQLNETLRQIKAYQHVRATKAEEVCPAGWEPGKKTLKPGPDLVGKIWEIWSPLKDH